MQMGPKTSLWDMFTNDGRLKRRWSQALAETDPRVSVEQMREILYKLCATPDASVHLWLSFLDTLFDGSRIQFLTKEDMATVERMGSVLSSGSAYQIRAEDIWFRLLQAYNVRGEENQARPLLVRIYRSLSASWDEKTRCARELAYRGSGDDASIKVYIEFLQATANPAMEQQMLAILSNACRVNFEADRIQLKHAKEIAQLLMNNRNIVIPVAWTTLGLCALMIEQEFSEASRYLMKALELNGRDKVAFIGLMVAWIYVGMHEKVIEAIRLPQYMDYTRDAIIVGIVQLNAMIRWLDSRDMPGTTPGDTQTLEYLKNLGLKKYVGELLDVTYARVCLLVGNARRALEVLAPLVSKNIAHPQWNYYAAWASVLTGNTDGISNCFAMSMLWPGSWTIACLFTDLDAKLAEKNSIPAFLKRTKSSQIKEAFHPIIEARVALTQSRQPETVTWKAGLGYIEEDMEALRTVIGVAFYYRNAASMERLIAHPLFFRLPLAEQMLWRGLFALQIKSQVQQAQELLDKAARQYGYSRAALVLVAHYLESNNIKQARHYLDMVTSTRQDSKIWLFQAYIAVREGQLDTAVKQLEKATTLPQSTPKVQYALGNLYLQKAVNAHLTGKTEHIGRYREQAAKVLDTALTKGKLELPADAAALVYCAQFVAYPQQRKQLYTKLWHEVERLDPFQRQHWVKWNAMLGQLWYGSSTEVVRAATEISTIIDSANRIVNDATVEVFAGSLASVSRRVEQVSQIEVIVSMLERLALRSELQTVKRACRAGITLALQARYRQADTQQRNQVRQELMRSAYQDSSNEILALLLAIVSLENSAKLAAVTILRNVQSYDTHIQRLCTCLADLLDKKAPSLRSLPKAPSETSSTLKLGYDLLHIAATFAASTPDKGYDPLNSLLQHYPKEVASYINIEHILPSFCAHLMKGGAAPPVVVEVIRNLAQGNLLAQQAATLARCATAIGEFDFACRLWEQALTQDNTPKNPLQQEYVKLLCHIAVKSHQAGNDQEAIRRLRQAADLQERSVVQ
jgi:tetratricopeptide (TPR) repeat protein